jgi:hypothetical protein
MTPKSLLTGKNTFGLELTLKIPCHPEEAGVLSADEGSRVAIRDPSLRKERSVQDDIKW